jgi:oligosaccharide repeat unit polymerase
MSLILWAIWCPLLLAVFIQVVNLTKCLYQWNTFSLFLPLYFIHNGLGLPLAVDALEAQQAITVPVGTIVVSSIGILISFVFVGLGCFAALRIFPSPKFKDIAGTSADINLPLGISYTSLIGLLFVAIGLTTVQISTSTSVNVWQFLSMSLSYEDYTYGRLGQSVENKLLQYSLGLLRFVVLPLLGYILYHERRKGLFQLVLFWLVSLIALFDSLATGHKSLVIIFFLGFFVFASLEKRGGNIQWSIKNVLFLLTLLLVIMPFLYMAQYSDLSFIDGIEATLYRLVVEPNRGLLLYFDIFPNQWPFLYGGSSVLLSELLYGRSTLPPHTMVAEFYGAVGSTWNVAFIGDAWADFGFLGIIIEATIIGFWLQAINYWFYSKKTTVVRIAFFVVMILIAHRFAQVGFLQVIGGFGFILGWLIYLVLTFNSKNEAS